MKFDFFQSEAFRVVFFLQHWNPKIIWTMLVPFSTLLPCTLASPSRWCCSTQCKLKSEAVQLRVSVNTVCGFWLKQFRLFISYFIFFYFVKQAFILHVRNTENSSKNQHEPDYCRWDMGQNAFWYSLFFSIMVGFVLFVSRNQEVIFKYILTHIAEFLIHTDQSPVRVIRKKEAQTRNIQHIVSYCTENS